MIDHVAANAAQHCTYAVRSEIYLFLRAWWLPCERYNCERSEKGNKGRPLDRRQQLSYYDVQNDPTLFMATFRNTWKAEEPKALLTRINAQCSLASDA